MEKMRVRLDAFEGPLDLLYDLIEKNEIDIYDIPIAQLTDQYLEYLDAAEDKDMEGMSAFLVMAATLLEIKSKLLLPKPKQEEEAEEDPREELVRRLLEYRKIKEATAGWKEREAEAAKILYKEADAALLEIRKKEESSLEEFLDGVTRDALYAAFMQVMERKELRVDHIRSSFHSVKRDSFTIEEKVAYLRDLLSIQPQVSFFSLFRQDSSRMEVVVTFLALLEMMKQKEILVEQDQIFGEIAIRKKTEEGTST